MFTVNCGRKSRSTRQSGLSMIEVLVSMVIVAFGLLGLLGLQARALSFQKDSFDGRAAAELADQMSDRIRANMLGFRDRNYIDNMNPNEAPLAFAACADPNQCTPAEIANRDQARWQQEVRRRLPSSAVYLVPDNANPAGWPRFVTVTVAWQEPNQSAVAAGRVVDPICADVIANLFAGLPGDYRCYRASVAP